MFNELFTLLHKPVLWQRSNETFWDDGHISKGMLDAHLDPDWEAASRKHSDIDRSVQWISTIIPEHAKILDLGCGPGLYTKRLTALGYDVTGIDFSRRSIEFAKSQDVITKYIYKNYLEIDYTDAFDVVTLIYCDYAALTAEERNTLMKKVHIALKDGGLFILDVFTEKHFSKKVSTTSWNLCEHGGFWSPEPHICLEATYLYENNRVAVDQYIVITADEMNEYLTWDTAYTVESMCDEISPHGFKVQEIFDDVCGSAYTNEADTLCFILKKE